MSTTLAPISAPDGFASPLEELAVPAARRRRGVGVILASAWLVTTVVLAIVAGLLPLKPYGALLYQPFVAPGLHHDVIGTILGTDELGRSQLSRVIYGARVSLFVGLVATGLGMFIGGSIGAAAGYFRGALDTLVTVLVDSALAFPALVLLLALSAVITPNILTLAVILAALTIPAFARIARATTLAYAQRESVAAARLMGATHVRILTREIAPNIALPVGSYALLMIAQVIVAESSLSFLGVGIPPPTPTWGEMISAGMADLSSTPWVVFVPAAALLLTVVSLNVVGDAARQRFDHREGQLQ